MPGLSAVGKIAELERVLGAQAVQDWAPSQTAFQAAVKTCHYRSNRARGVCWHCRGSVELVQSQEACSRSSERLFFPVLPAAPVKLLAIPCCKKFLQSCPASENLCGKAKPTGAPAQPGADKSLSHSDQALKNLGSCPHALLEEDRSRDEG